MYENYHHDPPLHQLLRAEFQLLRNREQGTYIHGEDLDGGGGRGTALTPLRASFAVLPDQVPPEPHPTTK